MDIEHLKQSIERLQAYQDQFKASNDAKDALPHDPHAAQYRMHTSSSDWSGFDNVYEVHSPQIILSEFTRNVSLGTLHCSAEG